MVYIEGFNLYHGLKDGLGRKYLWLNPEAVANRLLQPGQTLVKVKYFTAALRNKPGSQQNQHFYLGALNVGTRVEVHLGRFQEKSTSCRNCGSIWRTYEEKETDVSIAVALLEDAVNDLFDTALIVSADSDLCPAVRALRRLRPAKRVVAVFPPRRRSDDLRKAVHASLRLGDAIIRQSQFPNCVSDGVVNYYRPATWI